MSSLIGTTLRKYHILERVGRGGMAEVYKAYQPGLNRHVAVKVMHAHLAEDADFVARFEREATAIAQLRHPNIIQVYDFDVYQDQYYMVMEYIDGPTLKDDILQRQAAIEERSTNGQSARTYAIYSHLEIAQTLGGIASGLDYAHGLGVVHRDLKPANIMLTRDGQVILTDFGLVRLIDSTTFTMTGMVTGTPAYMSPEQAQGDQVDHTSDIYSLGIILYELLVGHTPFHAETALSVLMKQVSAANIPALNNIPYAEQLQQVLNRALAHDPLTRYQSAGELANSYREVVGISLNDLYETNYHQIVPQRSSDNDTRVQSLENFEVPDCPYRGLFAFREQDAPFFFGRDLFVDRLYAATREHQYLPVIGPSGSGKSSVVFAGLIPRLRRSGEWLICSLRPGTDPFNSLAQALYPLSEPHVSEIDQLVGTRRLAQSLRAESAQLNGYVNRILQRHAEGRRLFIFIDQFEELFTLVTDSALCRQFIALLSTPRLSDTFVVTFSLRADFLGAALAFPELGRILQTHPHILGAMTNFELTSVVESPAERQGVSFEAGLVERILQDVGDEPGNLPLLEFALTSLWDMQINRTLTHNAYDQIGRVDGALARHAESVYHDYDNDQRDRLKNIFTQMVRPGQGTEDTRRLATRQEIGDSDWALVQKLADARLVVTNRNIEGEETVEVVHEALLQSWERLRDWMNIDRTYRQWQERLRASIRQWEESEEDIGALLRGTPLTEAEGWFIQRATDLGEQEREFIEQSIELREKQAREREQRRRQTIIGLTVGLVVMLVLAVLFFLQRNSALEASTQAIQQRDQAEKNLSRQLAVQSQLVRANNFDLSLLLSAAAYKTADTPIAQQVLLESLITNPRLIATLRQHSSLTFGLAYSPDGLRMATGGIDGFIVIWDTQTNQEILRIEDAHDGAVRDLAFQNNSNVLVSSGGSDGVRIWDLRDSSRIGTIRSRDDRIVTHIAVHPFSGTIATANSDGIIRHWDPVSEETIGGPFLGHTDQITSLEFHPSGQLLGSTSIDGTAIIWDVATGNPIHYFQNAHEGIVWSGAFSPNGLLFATGGVDGRILRWQIASGETFGVPLKDGDEWITSLTFSQDGEFLVSGDRGGAVVVWDLDRQQPSPAITDLNAHTGIVWQVAYAPANGLIASGQRLASASQDGSVAVWNTTRLQRLGPISRPELQGHEDWVRGVAYSEDGNQLISGSKDGVLLMWDLTATPPTNRPFFTGSPINTVAYSPNGDLIAAGSSTVFDIIMWDVSLNRPIERTLQGHTNDIWALAFSQDSQILASGGEDGTIIIWDPINLREVARIENAHLGTVWALAFHPTTGQLFSGGSDGRLNVWDPTTWTQSGRSIAAHNNSITSLTFNNAGTILATAGEDRAILLWDGIALGDYGPGSTEPTPIGDPLIGHNRRVNAMAFNPDGTLLASGASGSADNFGSFGDGDDNIVLWDVATGEPVGPSILTRHGRVFALTFSPDGQTLVSGGWDQSVLMWDVNPEQWQRSVCLRVNRDFSESEWQEFFGSADVQEICQPFLPISSFSSVEDPQLSED